MRAGKQRSELRERLVYHARENRRAGAGSWVVDQSSSLPQVLVENGLRDIAPLAKGERVMLERKRLDGCYREVQHLLASKPTHELHKSKKLRNILKLI